MSTSIGQHRRGSVMVYMTIAMICLTAFASLAVDFGRVQLAKTQLERAAIAAARYAANGISDGTAVAKAIQSAAENTVDATPLVLQNADVTVGTWSAGSFSAGGTTPNAVQVNAYRTQARGTAVPLMFARVLGQANCNVTASATAFMNTNPVTMTGLTGIAVHSNLWVSSYDSSVTTSPSHSSYKTNATMQSNAAIGTGATTGNKLYGNAKLGPSGSIGGITVSGSSTTLSSNIATHSVTMQVVTNPYGIGSTFDATFDTSAPGGTYYFTSLTLEANVNITMAGPATIYMDGDFTAKNGASITAYNNIPSNLVIYQSSGHNFTANDSFVFVGKLDAPGSSLTLHDSCTWEGNMFCNAITVHDGDNIYLDEQLGTPGPGTISLVK